MKTLLKELRNQSELVGLPAYDCSDRLVGTVVESFVDAADSTSVFIVISMRNASGLSAEPFVIPARWFRLLHDGNRLSIRLDIDRSELTAAADWMELRWVGAVNAHWADAIDRDHCNPQWARQQRARQVPGSDGKPKTKRVLRLPRDRPGGAAPRDRTGSRRAAGARQPAGKDNRARRRRLTGADLNDEL